MISLLFRIVSLLKDDIPTWDDLQVISGDPNYCHHSSDGYAPLMVTTPSNETERDRRGIHSLCQCTVEAYLQRTQGPPPPVWKRGRNNRSYLHSYPPPTLARHNSAPTTHPSPAFYPERPPATQRTPRGHWMEARPMDAGHPPGPHGWDLRPLHPLFPRDPHQRAHGGQAHGTPLAPSARRHTSSYCSARQLHFLGRTARSFLGLGSWTLSSPSRGMIPGAPCARSDMVGGQLIMVSPRWGGSIRTFRPDPSGLGVLTEFVIGTQRGDIQVMGTYFPCPCAQSAGPTNRLWDKTQAWLGGQNIAEQYLPRQIQTRTLRHLSKVASDDIPQRIISLIGGDFNATWDGHHGPPQGHRPLGGNQLPPVTPGSAHLHDPAGLILPGRGTQIPHRPYSTHTTMSGILLIARGESSLGPTSVTSPTTDRSSWG